jgi:hypothetical protein
LDVELALMGLPPLRERGDDQRGDICPDEKEQKRVPKKSPESHA